MAGFRSTRSLGVSSSKTLSSFEGTGENQEDVLLISTPFGFEVESYPIISKHDPEQQLLQQQQHQMLDQVPYSEANSLSSESALGGIGAQGEKPIRLFPIVDKGPESEHVREHNRNGYPQSTEEGTLITGTEKTNEAWKKKMNDQVQERIFQLNETHSSSSQIIIDEDIREKPSNDELLGFTIRTNDGKATIVSLIFPPLSSLTLKGSVLRSSPDSEERLSVKGSKKADSAAISSNVHAEREKRKSRMDQSTSDGEKSKELKEKDSKRKKEKKEEKPVEEKYCKPGDYVIIVQDLTSPPFLDTTLQPAFLYVKVVSKLKKSKNYARK